MVDSFYVGSGLRQHHNRMIDPETNHLILLEDMDAILIMQILWKKV